MTLKDSRTEQHLRDAFASDAEANRRYLYQAARADGEGNKDAAAVLRSNAEGSTGHAHGHLDYLEAMHAGTELADEGEIDEDALTRRYLAESLAAETAAYTERFPEYAKVAREEGLDEIAEWFETLAVEKRKHSKRLQKALHALDDNRNG
ncbi:MAG: rubrerythrin family protein [Pseudomonadota bacterium]